MICIQCFDKVADLVLAFEQSNEDNKDFLHDEEKESIGHILKTMGGLQENGSRNVLMSTMKPQFYNAMNNTRRC